MRQLQAGHEQAAGGPHAGENPAGADQRDRPPRRPKRLKGLPPTFRPPQNPLGQKPVVAPERVVEITANPMSVSTLAEMLESPHDYRIEIADKDDDSVRAVFALTPRTANTNRLMREKGIPVLSIKEFAAYLKASAEARLNRQSGFSVAALKRVLAFRFAGREIGLEPVSIEYVGLTPAEKEALCSSSSTSSVDASPEGQVASTSTETSPSPPAEPASGTPA